jgi:hypothetical protein
LCRFLPISMVKSRSGGLGYSNAKTARRAFQILRLLGPGGTPPKPPAKLRNSPGNSVRISGGNIVTRYRICWRVISPRSTPAAALADEVPFDRHVRPPESMIDCMAAMRSGYRCTAVRGIEPAGGPYWTRGRFCSFRTKPSKMARTCLR